MSRPRFNRNEPGDWWFFLIVAAILTLIWIMVVKVGL